jgi:hypothetical protein
MFSKTLLPAFALFCSALALPADNPVNVTSKAETWTLTDLTLNSDGHGPGPYTNTTVTLALSLSTAGAPFSECATNWTYSTPVNTVPLGWLPCTATNLWFRINRSPKNGPLESFDFPPLDLEFLEVGSWQKDSNGKYYLDKKTASFSLINLDNVASDTGVGFGCGRHNPSRSLSCRAMNKHAIGELKMDFQVTASKTVSL